MLTILLIMGMLTPHTDRDAIIMDIGIMGTMTTTTILKEGTGVTLMEAISVDTVEGWGTGAGGSLPHKKIR